MIETNTVCGKTELYANGGAGATYLTEAKTTMFHNFWTRKILGEGETPEDFMEVTAAQKAAFEKAAAEFVPPQQWLIDQWNTAFYKDFKFPGSNTYSFGKWNPDTGYFEGNGLKDITTEQAIKILQRSYYFTLQEIPKFARPEGLNQWSAVRTAAFCRTYVPLFSLYYDPQISSIFAYNTELEAITFYGGYSGNAGRFNFKSTFLGCSKLRFVYVSDVRMDSGAFSGCTALEEISAWKAWGNIYLGSCPKFSLKKIEQWISNYTEKSATFTLHADLYDKIMDESSEWHHLLAAAQEKNITLATP